jgi:hypothetical protein
MIEALIATRIQLEKMAKGEDGFAFTTIEPSAASETSSLAGAHVNINVVGRHRTIAFCRPGHPSRRQPTTLFA